MSGASGGGRSLKSWATLFGVLIVASSVGLPVASWSIALALILIVVASLATIVGMKEAAKGFGQPILTLLAVGLGGPALTAMARTTLADPNVRTVAGWLGPAAVLGGIVLLIGKAAAHPTEKHVPHRPSFRRRAVIVDPEHREGARPHETAPGPTRRGAGTDDLDLFDGGPHARR